jgi:hypothetical protein
LYFLTEYNTCNFDYCYYYWYNQWPAASKPPSLQPAINVQVWPSHHYVRGGRTTLRVLAVLPGQSTNAATAHSSAYIDYVTLGSSVNAVSTDVQQLAKNCSSYGLKLNMAKCEAISNQPIEDGSILASFQHFLPNAASLLGAPLSRGETMEKITAARCEDLTRMISRFELISAHDALVLLKCSVSTSRLQYTIRNPPCAGHPLLSKFNDLLHTATSKICNIALSNDQWLQASLPVKNGGLGIRRVASLATSAYLASTAGTLGLQNRILGRCSSSIKQQHQQP